jgi:hypothetical protein
LVRRREHPTHHSADASEESKESTGDHGKGGIAEISSFHLRELTRDNALEFHPITGLEHASGDDQGCIFAPPPNCERIHRSILKEAQGRN